MLQVFAVYDQAGNVLHNLLFFLLSVTDIAEVETLQLRLYLQRTVRQYLRNGTQLPRHNLGPREVQRAQIGVHQSLLQQLV